ncbi:MAG: anti-sigma factor [Flavobacteriia bacterium]|nr:anti-sigma factor [Flavobacteriia bacterium]
MVYTFSVVDVKEYIASGILESVVLGFASEQEMREVSCLSHIYPEIKAELESIEQAFEKMAVEGAVEPSVELKATIIEKISQTEQLPVQTPNETLNNTEEPAKIIQMNAPSADSPNPWKWMVAASLLLLLGVGSLWIIATNRSNDLSNQVADLQQQKKVDEQVLTAMQLEQDHLQSVQSMVVDHDMRKVILMGTPKDPKACVHFMWSNSSNKGIMVAECITDPPTDMQYQLWAIADGKPVSLGLFDHEEVMNTTDPFDINMDNVSAFAITLEKKGGVASPTMEYSVVMGSTEG